MSRRKQPPAKPTVYTRPYWFDRGQSLCKLHGWPQSDPGDGLGLVGRYTAAVNRPVGSLDAGELFLLFTQQTDPHYLVPVALDLLRGRVDAALLRCVLQRPATFWPTHPYLRGELVALLEGLAARLAELDEDLASEAAAFVVRRRGS
jgi:hypothetical protein